jgi:eukaryotic-like serine/threonine-protein kinase
MDLGLQSIHPVMTPGTRVEHWRILESLGAQAHGALYRVEDVRRPGAALVMRLSSRKGDGRCGDRVARVNTAHSNVARLHGYGRWLKPGDGSFFCVREDVRGLSVSRWVESTNPTFLQISAMLCRLATALDDVHARDTWHRDLHPDNIHVRHEDGEPVLLDLRDGGNECLGSLLESPLPLDMQVYRSPESLRFLRTNVGREHARYYFRPTDDLYALGAIAYWLVTGHAPFSSTLPPEQLHTEIELRAPLPPWEVNERVPKPLGAILLRLVSKLPEARPHSGESLCAELAVAVSAGARSMWARRVFDWEPDEAIAEASGRRVRLPPAPKVCPLPGPRLPRVVHFRSPSERRAPEVPPAPKEPEPLGPWSRMM